jgi:hypothetical protein
MSSEIFNKIKEKSVINFLIEINNFENIYIITKKECFVYNHKSKPTKLENTPPDGEYNYLGCIDLKQKENANEGKEFTMLHVFSKIKNINPGIYKNIHDNTFYQLHNNEWYPINKNTINKFKFSGTNIIIEYPSYPPYGQYIKEDHVEEDEKPYNIFVNEQVELAKNGEEFTMTQEVADKLPSDNSMLYEQVEDKEIILSKFNNEWHDKDKDIINKINIEEEPYINKKYQNEINARLHRLKSDDSDPGNPPSGLLDLPAAPIGPIGEVNTHQDLEDLQERLKQLQKDNPSDRLTQKKLVSSGGFKIRKTIKKKYRKSKFITRKIKKKIILKKPRTLKRKYKRIL